MRSSFFGLNVASNGLYTAQRGLDVINHNINNVNTPGYSRQMSVQTAAPAMSVHDGTGMIGTGSLSASVDRIHDEYLDFKYWSESDTFGEWDVKAIQLTDIEKTFNEPSDSGFNVVINNYFAAVQELSKDPSSLAARKLLIGEGVTLTKYFNSVAAHLEKLQSDLNYNIKLKVDEINSYGRQIQQLNKQIYAAEIDNNKANDLRDQRTYLVDKLSKLVNVQASEVAVGVLPNGQQEKHFLITINGKAFVDHYSLSQLKVEQREKKLNVDEDIENLYEVSWEDGNLLEVKGGELKGYIDMRDGNEGVDQGNGASPNYKGVPFYVKKLNEFVRKFALAMNEGITVQTDDLNGTIYSKTTSGHADGYGMKKPGGSTSPAGIRLFTMKGWSHKQNAVSEIYTSEFIGSANSVDDIGNLYNKLTAKNFSISGDLIHEESGEYNIAASSTSGLSEDGSNLLNLIEMRHDGHLFMEGNPEDYMKALISTLGIDTQQAMQISKTQIVIMGQIENRRSSVSGVSLNEEMSNMVKYQHAYTAAAKMISTLSEIYDTLVNRVGISGR
ncbi:flagellar hook-associated protein FlgK [Pseudobacteroides cellulosolvens]|uniref:Flagellar hook-associated protein 1 n=1 Tax=Pseudobacteroides cellulosolvens ATCC 35603 = DSM 2933 TaxID=398512 RepID=A0A0L6JT81_9FIRM|nr:flagellar hook-associated protein FlgK [Pseudobacteroides cellulosolvens]KNY28627.1 flagellar hook-associated protein FlgK [Pseudobacteroides cellulosolvens ATCC 35603 = DSM 2933]